MTVLISPIHIHWVTAVVCFLFLFIIKNEIGRYLLMGMFGVVAFFLGVHFDNGREYEITLINQNKVKIQAMDSGRTYYCVPEKITETIDKDNL